MVICINKTPFFLQIHPKNIYIKSEPEKCRIILLDNL